MQATPNPKPLTGFSPDEQAIAAAHARIAPHIPRTPVLTSASLDAMAGARLFFKCDNFQKTGSFKIRGATNAVFSLSEEEAARGVVTHSSGNHAAALACAARWRGIPAWIVMPKNAPAVKCRAVEGYGGKITFCEPRVSARQERSEEHTSELQSQSNLVCRLLLEKKKKKMNTRRASDETCAEELRHLHAGKRGVVLCALLRHAQILRVRVIINRAHKATLASVRRA